MRLVAYLMEENFPCKKSFPIQVNYVANTFWSKLCCGRGVGDAKQL